MNIIHAEKGLFRIENPVVTIGIFDGVHRGHRVILDALRQKARQIQGETVVITLWPHPRMVLNTDFSDLKLLNTPEEKEQLFRDAGIDHLLVIPFTKEFAKTEPCDFVVEYLVKKLQIRHLIVGFDHHFGRDREGNFSKIRECACQYGFTVERTDAIHWEGTTISSTVIRNLLEQGEVEKAGTFLGYSYTLRGTVNGGSQIGRQIGFPTANIFPANPYKLIPGDGVYVGEVGVGDIRYGGMLNIGRKPTVNKDENHRTIEVHIFDFDQDIYGKSITFAFLKKLRDEQKFASLHDLKHQLQEDKQKSVGFLKDLKNQRRENN